MIERDIKTNQELADIFTIFHDGVIEDFQIDENNLYLTIGCVYLAELVNPSFESFILKLINIDKLELNSYSYITDHSNTEDYPIIISDIETIFEVEIDIFNAKSDNEFVKVNIWIVNDKSRFVANQLNIKCENYSLYNEENKPFSINRLYKISENYWTKFEEKKN